MNPSLTIALLGQAGVGKSFVGNTLVYYLQNQTLPDENTIQPSIFEENFSPYAEMYKMGRSCITKESCQDFNQMRINILETVAIGQLEGASRKKSCQMIIEEIKQKYQNVRYIIIFNKEKQFEGENLKDFYDYYEALQESENLFIFLNQRDYSRNNISEYILNSYLKQQQYYDKLYQNLGELCNIFNQRGNKELEQMHIKQNNQIIYEEKPCEIIQQEVKQNDDQKILYQFHKNLLSQQFINSLKQHHIQVISENSEIPQTEAHLILFDFSKLKKIFCFGNPQKEFLVKFSDIKFKQNIILFQKKEEQLDPKIENLIRQSQWRLLRDQCQDSLVSFMNKIHQPINLEEVVNLLNDC